MLSASANTLHPAFSQRPPDRLLTAHSTIPKDRQLLREDLRVWSYQEPPLAVGSYTLVVSQHLQITDPDTKQKVEQDLASPDTKLRVSAPRFRLNDPQNDIHSVYPAPGHSEYAKTLAHVVLCRDTSPWERQVSGTDHASGSNRMPWLAVLSFTEDELVLDEPTMRIAGFASKTPPPNSHGAIATTAEQLESLTNVISPLSGNANLAAEQKGYQNGDEVNALLLRKGLFQDSLFASYNTPAGETPRKNPVWTGAPDLSRFRYMAHVREAHGGFMASTVDLMSESGVGVNPQPRFSVVVSSRTGPHENESPRRIISHLISLQDLSEMSFSETQSHVEFAALVSLYSWDWMCVPEGHQDFTATMVQLGTNVSPLRIEIPKDFASSLQEAREEHDNYQGDVKKQEDHKQTDDIGSKSVAPCQDPMAEWLKMTLDAGYTLKMHTLPTGQLSRSLLRGPLIPVMPSQQMIHPFSMDGNDLTLIDEDTGLEDVSYKTAWHLGRSLGIADRSFAAALLRLRGHIHAQTVQRVKAKRAVKTGVETDPSNEIANLTAESLLSKVTKSLDQLEEAHGISSLSEKGASARWLRTQHDRKNRVLSRLSAAGAPIDLESEIYTEELGEMAHAFFGLPPKNGEQAVGSLPPLQERSIDSDAILVRAWAIDKFYLAGIPLHYLLPDPDMLPRETIRTFCVDPTWIDAVLDGGLSMANHFARGDDGVRGAIKDSLNRYLEEKRQHGPGKDTTLQLPRWGFFLRSIAVAAFPDLKVEAQFSEPVPSGIHEVLYTQVLSDDVLICLFDRIPGEANFESIRISQPPHQQSFAVGSRLMSTSLDTVVRPVPLVKIADAPVGQQRDNLRAELAHITRSWSKLDTSPLYDWDARMLRPEAFLKQYTNDVSAKNGSKVWKWSGSDLDGPSALLALQLGTPNLALTLQLDRHERLEGDNGDSDNSRTRWTDPPARLHIRPRPKAIEDDGNSRNVIAVARISPSPNQTKGPPDPVWVPLKQSNNAVPQLALFSKRSGSSKPKEILTSNGLVCCNTQDSLFRNLEYPKQAEWCPQPSNAQCFPIFDPPDPSAESSTSFLHNGSTICALNKPMDLVFSLKEATQQYSYPEQIELRIPVQVGVMGGDAAGEDITHPAPLLMLPGSLAAPVLPIIQGLTGNALWSYTSRVVLASMYRPPEKNTNPEGNHKPAVGDAVQLYPGASLLLVITARPRFLTNKMKYNFFDASFLMRQVNVIRPVGSSFDTQFDVSWKDRVVYPRLVTVRSGITVKIGKPTKLQLKDGRWRLVLSVQCSTPLGPEEEIVSSSRIRGFHSQGTPIITQRPSVTEAHPSSWTTYTSDYTLGALDEDIPELVEVRVVSRFTGRALGPWTSPYFFPKLPLLEPLDNVRFAWNLEGIHVSWLPKQGCNAKVEFVSGSQIPIQDGKALLPQSSFGFLYGEPNITVEYVLNVDIGNTEGQLESTRKRYEVIPLLLTTSESPHSPPSTFPLAKFDLSQIPALHRDSPLIPLRMLGELWFVGTDGRVLRLYCRREPLKDINNPPTAIAKPPDLRGPIPMSCGGLDLCKDPQQHDSRFFMCFVTPEGRLHALDRSQNNWFTMKKVESGLEGPPWNRPDGYVHRAAGGSVRSLIGQMGKYMLWIGPEGEVCITIYHSNETDFCGTRVLLPAGTAATGVSQSIFATSFSMSNGRDFFFVSRDGGLRHMRFTNQSSDQLTYRVQGPVDIVPDIGTARISVGDGQSRAAGCGPVVVETLRGPYPKYYHPLRRFFVFWVDGTNGRVCATTALLPQPYGGDLTEAVWSPKFYISAPGAEAHATASRLTVCARRLSDGAMCQDGWRGPVDTGGTDRDDNGCVLYVYWFDQTGRFRASRCIDDKSEKYLQWTECIMPAHVDTNVRIDIAKLEPGRKLELALLPSGVYKSDTQNLVEVFWVDGMGGLQSIGVDLGFIKPTG